MCSRMAFLCGIVFALTIPYATAGAYSGGSGTPDDPYQIGTVADWRELALASGDWDKHLILTADLDFQNQRVLPVSVPMLSRSGPFSGKYSTPRKSNQGIRWWLWYNSVGYRTQERKQDYVTTSPV